MTLSELSENSTMTLALSCVSYRTEKNEIINTRLPAIKTALEANLALANDDENFDAQSRAEIQTEIDEINSFLA